MIMLFDTQRNFYVPDGSKWVAQDKDGSWWAYNQKPTLSDHRWMPRGNSRTTRITNRGDCPVSNDFKGELYVIA